MQIFIMFDYDRPDESCIFSTREAAEARVAVEKNNSNGLKCFDIIEKKLDPPCPEDKSQIKTLAIVYFSGKKPEKWVYDTFERREVPGKHRSGLIIGGSGTFTFWSFDGPGVLATQIVEASERFYNGEKLESDVVRTAREARERGATM